MDGFDRRHRDRLKILGAEVIYTLKNGQFAIKPLIDLTRSSARFEVEHSIQNKDFIKLEIIIPGKDKIPVKGTVIRLSDPVSEDPSYVVIQFLPFGTDERYNSMESYDLLGALIEEILMPARAS